jgi:hypothetical protein
MAIDINQYRAVIGAFNLKPPKTRKIFYDAGGTEFASDFKDGCSNIFYSLLSVLYITLLCWDLSFFMVINNYLLLMCGDVHPHPGPDSYFGNLTFCHVNIRSINAENRWNAFVNQLANSYDIITTSETWLGEKHKNSKFDIQALIDWIATPNAEGALWYGLRTQLSPNVEMIYRYQNMRFYGYN